MMENFTENLPVLLILVFTAITFLQSGLDKVFDWKGNIGWLKGHFEATFMRKMVPLLVAVILVMEVLTGVMAALAIFTLLSSGSHGFALGALTLGAITLLMLLFGQRMAKDYAGAFTITGYFMVVIFGIFILTA